MDCIAWYLFQSKFICEEEEEEVSGVRFVSIFCMWEIYLQFLLRSGVGHGSEMQLFLLWNLFSFQNI